MVLARLPRCWHAVVGG